MSAAGAAAWLLVVSVAAGALASPDQILEGGVPPFACLDPDGSAGAGIPFANLCETLDFTPLDNPVDEGTPNSILIQTRAGAFHPSKTIAESQLIAARPSLLLLIPEHSFSELADRTRFPKLPGIAFSNGMVLWGLDGMVRGLEGQAARAEADPEFLARHGLRRAPPGADPEALRDAAHQILFPGDPTSPAPTFDSFFPRLLQARIDRNRALGLAQPDFMTRTEADHVSEFGAAIADRARLSAQPTERETVPGLGTGT